MRWKRRRRLRQQRRLGSPREGRISPERAQLQAWISEAPARAGAAKAAAAQVAKKPRAKAGKGT